MKHDRVQVMKHDRTCVMKHDRVRRRQSVIVMKHDRAQMMKNHGHVWMMKCDHDEVRLHVGNDEV